MYVKGKETHGMCLDSQSVETLICRVCCINTIETLLPNLSENLFVPSVKYAGMS